VTTQGPSPLASTLRVASGRSPGPNASACSADCATRPGQGEASPCTWTSSCTRCAATRSASVQAPAGCNRPGCRRRQAQEQTLPPPQGLAEAAAQACALGIAEGLRRLAAQQAEQLLVVADPQLPAARQPVAAAGRPGRAA
jgi:hypothetical protein